MRAATWLVRRLGLAGVALALILAAARPALAQGGLYGVVDTPAINGTVSEPFQIRGWALWSGATSGSGIDAVHVYGCVLNGCPSPVFWGAATIGLPRPDVVAAYGYPSGATSGYSFTMAGLAPETYYVQVWTRNATTGVWLPFITTFTVTSPPEHVIDQPAALASVAQPFTVGGWAIDANAPTGTGVDLVGINAYHNFGSGSPAYALGGVVPSDPRPDVAAARGSRFLNSGYHFTVSGQPPGWYRFINWAHSTASGIWTGRTQDAYVDIPTVSLEINRSGTGTGSIVGTGLSCPGGSNTQAMPCGASYALGTVAWITAVPDPGSTFAGWGGGCLGPQVTCGVTLNGDRYTFAYFTKTPDTVATTYYHTDAIGSVRALSDDTGATVIRHDYLPFGEDTQPLAGDPMRFAGKELDPESALMNFEARYYRNTWGRFTQVDPIGGSLADPQSWNRYAYARGNPISFIDPDGRHAYRTGVDCPHDGSPFCPGNPGFDPILYGFGNGNRCIGIHCGSGKTTPPPTTTQPPTDILGNPETAAPNLQDGSGGTTPPNHDDHDESDETKKPDCPAVPTAPPGANVNANMHQARMNALWNPLWIPWFKRQVQYGGPWDYKTKGPQYEDFGNFNYGATGTAAFAPTFTLLRAGGWAQRNHPSSPQFPGEPGSLLSIFLNPFGGTAPYGDDPHDQQLIQNGIVYAEKGCGG